MLERGVKFSFSYFGQSLEIIAYWPKEFMDLFQCLAEHLISFAFVIPLRKWTSFPYFSNFLGFFALLVFYIRRLASSELHRTHLNATHLRINAFYTTLECIAIYSVMRSIDYCSLKAFWQCIPYSSYKFVRSSPSPLFLPFVQLLELSLSAFSLNIF